LTSKAESAYCWHIVDDNELEQTGYDVCEVCSVVFNKLFTLVGSQSGRFLLAQRDTYESPDRITGY